MIKVSPSILAADFAHLNTDIKRVEHCADMLHLDVMDGHFVPNISFGVPVIEAVRKNTTMFLDTHLMISRPQDYIEAFVKAGSDLICFHLESDCDIDKTIDLIHSFGKKAAISLKPETPAQAVFPYLKKLDMVLVMTVEPGFGGQAFQPQMLPKIEAIRTEANAVNPALDIQVDGGINRETAPKVVKAGANILVAGSSIFGSDDAAAEVSYLQNLVN